MSRGSAGRLYTLLDAAIDGGRVEDFGVVGAGLVDAHRRGLPVAETWLVSAAVFRECSHAGLPPGHDPATLVRAIHKPSGVERAARARERMRELALPSELGKELALLVERHGNEGSGLCLRASATLPDASLVTLAGLDRVLYGIRTWSDLERGVAALWSAVVDEEPLWVLRHHRQRDVAMAVVVQRVGGVRGQAILRTREPHTPQDEGADSFLLASSLGFGPPVIDGAAAVDIVRVASDGSALARRVSCKSAAWVASDRGLVLEPVPNETAREPALGDAALKKSSDVWKKIEHAPARELELLFGPDDSPSVLAAREVQGEGFPLGGSRESVWSRTGLADLLPGVPTPLSSSLVEGFVESSLRSTLDSLGAELDRDATLVATVHGRHYLNVSAMVPALSGVPGIDPAVIVQLLRGGNTAAVARTLDMRSRGASLAVLSLAAARLALQERKLNEASARFESDAEQHRRWLAEMDLAILPDDSLVTTLRESHGFLESTGRVLLSSSVVALAAHIALEAALARVLPDGASRTAYALTSGLADLESARSAMALVQVVELLRADPEAKSKLEHAGRTSDLPESPGRRALAEWLERFGDRGLVELEVERPRYTEEPAPVFAMLRAGLRAEPTDPEAMLSRVRAAADSELALLESRAGRVEMLLIRTLLARARALSLLRERMRVWMARTIGMTRSVALDVDRRLLRLDPTLPRGGVFYLRHTELLSATGRTRADLGPIVRMRQAAHRRGLERADPPDTFIGVPPRIAALPFDSRRLLGSGASAGSATGRVRLLGPAGAGAERVEPGDVIVVRTPDVGLAPLFFWAGAVVADSGSPLSHAAVVAREIGRPAVFGVLAASSTLCEGELVRVDGDKGLVERIES